MSQTPLEFQPGEASLTKLSRPEENVIQTTLTDFTRILDRIFGDIGTWLDDEGADLSRRGKVRANVRERFLDERATWDATIKTMNVEGASAGRELAIQRHSLDVAFNLTREEVFQALESQSLRMSEFTRKRMVGDLSEALVRAYGEGMSIRDISQTLQEEVFVDMKGYEAERVARTNVIAGSNKGAHEAYAESVAIGKEWLATPGDNRTRDTHLEAHGQRRLMNDTFLVGGHKAMHPGDPSLPPQELINCRCTEIPVFDPDEIGM